MNYRVVEKTISCMRTAPCMAAVDGSWKKDFLCLSFTLILFLHLILLEM